MKRKVKILSLAWFMICAISLKSQVSLQDSSTIIPMFSAFYSLQFPGGDMAKQYGANSVIGGDFKLKLPSKWVFSADFSYMFGDGIKNKDSLFSLIMTQNGEIIDGYGTFAFWQVYERGFFVSGNFGRLFPVFNSNPNSGILLMLGGGYLQHKYRIEIRDKTAPQLRDDYKKGYDRLRGGPMAKQFIGYLYTGNTKVINFFIGLEFVQAWTKDMRKYNFNDMKYTDGNYLDLLYSIKVGWFIPLHKRAPKEFYFN